MGVTRGLDAEIWSAINSTAYKIETHYEAQVIFYYGSIHDAFLKDFRNFIERVASESDKKKRLAFFLRTGGGIVQACEKIVEMVRYYYEEVYFFVPDIAMSAGTILCMSGDKIFMDYSSSLGPIDPQVLVSADGRDQLVPALGHLDMVEKLIEKSRDGTITGAEFAILQNQNLALLRSYQQALDLSVQLLKDWLATYKFKTWTVHRGSTNHDRKGSVVTDEDKQKRAQEIAEKLGNNKIWHSHGRMIGIQTLRRELKLEIEDYSGDDQARQLIRRYADLLTEYIERLRLPFYLHHHKYHQ